MTSSLDVAGIAPAVVAAVQAAAVIVQVYWDRRQRTAGTTQTPDPLRAARKAVGGGPVVVRVHLGSRGGGDAVVLVRVGDGAGGATLRPVKEHGPW